MNGRDRVLRGGGVARREVRDRDGPDKGGSRGTRADLKSPLERWLREGYSDGDAERPLDSPTRSPRWGASDDGGALGTLLRRLFDL
jgi:hypothetical protein